MLSTVSRHADSFSLDPALMFIWVNILPILGREFQPLIYLSGMIVGEASKKGDMDVNPVRAKVRS
jgi:predicted membrane GTPase involved in stress response